MGPSRRRLLVWLLAFGSTAYASSGRFLPAQLDPNATGEEIALEAERVNRGFTGERSTFSLVLINAQGEQTERRLTLELREDDQDENQSRIDFDWPENVRGTVLLTHAHKEGDDDQWLYLPSAKRVRRIAAGHKTGSFMGSEFTYEDLAPPVLSKYTHQRLADGEVDGTACFQIERRPRTEGSGYSRELAFLDQKRLVPLKIEFYDRKNELLKVAFYRDYATFGSYHRAALIRMENRQTRRVSELKAESRQLGLALDAQRFRSQALGQ
jgi:hypothetical protein